MADTMPKANVKARNTSADASLCAQTEKTHKKP